MPIRGSANFQSFLPFIEDGDQLPNSDSDLDEEGCTDVCLYFNYLLISFLG